MLILTRKVGQSLILGDDIIITILSDHYGQIKIGIESPRDVTVHREEVYKRIQSEVNPEL